MLRRERGVKGLDAESVRVALEALRGHERHGAEPADVAIMEIATVVESQPEGGVRRLFGREGAAAEEQGAGEARLDDDSIAGIELENDQLRSAPAAEHLGASESLREPGRRDVAEHVGSRDLDARDRSPADLAIEVARDGLSFRKL